MTRPPQPPRFPPTYQRFLKLLDRDPVLGSHGEKLVGRLRRMSEAVDKKWATPYLPWFPDHGPRHSMRVINRFFEMVPADLLPTSGNDAPNGLSILETYLLCAAAWVHDIGMQNVRACSPTAVLGSLTEQNFQDVRLNHPRIGSDMILSAPEAYGMPADPDAKMVIAMLVRAHGTAQFSAVLPGFEHLGQPFGMTAPVRGHLLAALLLMADELDLHGTRARFPDEDLARLSRSSSAHNLKHHYTSAVNIRHRDGTIDLRLKLEFPGDDRLSLEDADAVRLWITRKLRHQIGVVNPILLHGYDRTPGFYGRVSFNHHIEVKLERARRTDDPSVRLSMNRGAAAYIHAEVSESTIVDHCATIDQIKRALANRPRLLVVSSPAATDDGVLEDIAYWLKYYLDSGVHQTLFLDRWRPGQSALDVVRDLDSRMDPSGRALANQRSWDELQRRLEQRKRSNGVVIYGLTHLSQPDRLVILELLAGSHRQQFVVVSPGLPSVPPQALSVSVAPLDATEVAEQFQTVMHEAHVISALAEIRLSYSQAALAMEMMESQLEQPALVPW